MAICKQTGASGQMEPSATTAGRFATMLGSMASANFAMVMSTGIVSVALHLLGHTAEAQLLFATNVLLFSVQVLLYTLRLFRFPRRFADDFTDHGKGPGFLTIVAGTCILGNQFALIGHNAAAALALFWIGVGLWLPLQWGVLYRLFSAPAKPPVEKGINGAWLLLTVSTQAIVILGCIVFPHTRWNPDLAFFSLSALFMLGFMLYILVIAMIFYRFSYKDLEPAQLSPTYWINAGAAAITTLAGSELILKSQASHLLEGLLPFIRGTALLAWAMATFWIPLLLLLGWWRHVRNGYPFTYTAEYWGMVFPLGMYTACTFMLSKALDFTQLMDIPRLFVFVACAAWLATFAAMLRSRGCQLLGSKKSQ